VGASTALPARFGRRRRRRRRRRSSRRLFGGTWRTALKAPSGRMASLSQVRSQSGSYTFYLLFLAAHGDVKTLYADVALIDDYGWSDRRVLK